LVKDPTKSFRFSNAEIISNIVIRADYAKIYYQVDNTTNIFVNFKNLCVTGNEQDKKEIKIVELAQLLISARSQVEIKYFNKNFLPIRFYQ
jgi:hypothetical protein